MMKRFVQTVFLAAAVASGVPAAAHHSFAMFDSSKVLTLDGTIYKVEWSNPHSWIWVMAPDPRKPGAVVTWALEGGSPGTFSRMGFTKADFTSGKKAKVDIHPLKDGTAGGQFLRITYADGRTIGSLLTPIEALRAQGVGN